MHPQMYDPQNPHKVQFIIQPYLVNAVYGYVYPETCPATNFGRPCYPVPCNPEEFAKLCLAKGLGIQDVVSLAPIWLLDPCGNKVGSRPGPLAIEDYIHAYYAAKNPISVGGRLAELAGKATVNPKLGPEGRIFTHTDLMTDHDSLCSDDADFVMMLRTNSGCETMEPVKMANIKQEADMMNIKQEPEAEH